MPKRKRSSRESREPQRKWRKVIIYSDSDESENSDSEQQNNQEVPSAEAPTLQNNASPGEDLPAEKTSDPLPEESVPDLDAELLAALGDPAEDTPDFGENILQDLTQRLLPVLRKGIPNDKKDSILKESTIPGNCKLLRAPTLNAEISAAISDIARARDKKLENNQNQLGLGISAVGRGLSLLITGDDKQNKIQAIKAISDGCRILADLHCTETQARVKLITPGLDKAFLHVIKNVERDETLFSNKLSEKIKVSKTIEKQGLQIKKTMISQKSSPIPSQANSTSRSRNQGKWMASSRYQPPNRRGRGGAQRHGSVTRRSQSSTFVGKTSTASNSKQRAPTR